jgi:hypothetical protein
MFRPIPFLVIVFFIASCKKVSEPEEEFLPKMSYINLSDTVLNFSGSPIIFDLNGDGQKDVRFNTLLVGDPLYQVDKKQWLVTTSFDTNLPIQDERMPVMHSMDDIPITDFLGYNWYNANSVLLAQRIEGMTGQLYWEGDWKEANHNYIPIQIKRDNALYNGWVEVSFSINNEKLILHNAAICKEKNRPIKAGK